MNEQQSAEKVIWAANDMAFPVLDREQTPNGTYQLGLTKREYFAAVALQGLLACPHQMCNDIENQAGLAVEYADRLIRELAR